MALPRGISVSGEISEILCDKDEAVLLRGDHALFCEQNVKNCRGAR